ncbi:hypothetical protein HJG60_008259 [Phyllostomus discolor]|uniref:Uncharacterized protein n=1 Tax=Phyllostomus discolor TaxID=89673 RepID=A0A833Z6S7_9CHIR|nr:hypothetical protein HJG60_008259 [Phyllostomus discolor]
MTFPVLFQIYSFIHLSILLLSISEFIRCFLYAKSFDRWDANKISSHPQRFTRDQLLSCQCGTMEPDILCLQICLLCVTVFLCLGSSSGWWVVVGGRGVRVARSSDGHQVLTFSRSSDTILPCSRRHSCIAHQMTPVSSSGVQTTLMNDVFNWLLQCS